MTAGFHALGSIIYSLCRFQVLHGMIFHKYNELHMANMWCVKCEVVASLQIIIVNILFAPPHPSGCILECYGR